MCDGHVIGMLVSNQVPAPVLLHCRRETRLIKSNQCLDKSQIILDWIKLGNMCVLSPYLICVLWLCRI